MLLKRDFRVRFTKAVLLASRKLGGLGLGLPLQANTLGHQSEVSLQSTQPLFLTNSCSEDDFRGGRGGGRFDRYEDRRGGGYGGGYRGYGGRYDDNYRGSSRYEDRDHRSYGRRDDYGSRGIDRYASGGRDDRYSSRGDDRRGGGGGGGYDRSHGSYGDSAPRESRDAYGGRASYDRPDDRYSRR